MKVNNERRPWISMVAFLAIACAVLVLSGLLVGAAPPPRPATFYGTVKVNGANPPTWVTVEAQIGGVTYATAPVRAVGNDVVYLIDVPGDRDDQPGKQGGVAGDTIQFRVGGLLCAQTEVWQEARYQQLNLTATGALPTATLTQTPSPTATPTQTPAVTATPTPTNTPSVTAAPTTVDLTPFNTTVRDTYINEWEPNRNYGTGPDRFRIRVYGPHSRGLVYFDTSAIPTNARVTSARLNVYLDNYDDGKGPTIVSIYKVLADWNDTQATWNHRLTGVPWASPGCTGTSDRSATVASSLQVNNVSTWYAWDVTSLVQEWVRNPADNKGMLLVNSTFRDLRFHSGDEPSRPPFLRVEYGPGDPSPTSSPTPSAPPTGNVPEIQNPTRGGNEAYISSVNPTANYVNQLRVYGPGVYRSLLKFPGVAQIPAGSQVLSATLRLTASNYNDGRDWSLDVGAYLVNRYWEASQVTWNMASAAVPWGLAGCNSVPEDRAVMPVDTQTLKAVSTGTKPAERKTYTWNVTGIVQAWVNDANSRDAGMLLMASSGPYRDIGFWSSSYMSEQGRDLHPLLTVHWAAPAPTATPTPTFTPTPSAGTVRGTVYYDRNRNGQRDAGELGVLGATVQLLSGSVVVLQQNTPGGGNYQFDNVLAGAFTVRVLLSPGVQSSDQNPRPVTVTAGGTTTADFGIYWAQYLALIRRN